MTRHPTSEFSPSSRDRQGEIRATHDPRQRGSLHPTRTRPPSPCPGPITQLVFLDEQGEVRVDLAHPPCSLPINFHQETVINTIGKDIKDGKEGLPPLRNPPFLGTADDLDTLSHQNEPSGSVLCIEAFSRILLNVHAVLHTIRNRYAQHGIYTYSGIVLVAVNPSQRVTRCGPEIIQAYSGRERGELEPHLFSIAEEDAYTAMVKDGVGQTTIVSGERYSVFFYPALVILHVCQWRR